MSKIYQKTLPAGENAGFTLIELLVVVLIIGILAAVALPKYELAVEKSRAAEALAVLKNLRDAQELYYMANGAYSSDLTLLDIEPPESKNFNYGWWSDFSVYAYSKTKPYLLAYRVSQNSGDSIVCGTDSQSGSSDFEYARKICASLGAKVTSASTGQSTRWPIVQ